jgi:very-short-patch-repair endonuclease
MPYEYNCLFCLKYFVHKDHNKKYCSQKCCKNASKKGRDAKCFWCSKIFYKPKAKDFYEKDFCCKKCAMDFQRSRRPVRVCLFCKKEFCKKARNNAKYCSWNCRKNSEENLQHLANIRRQQAVRKENKLERKGYDILNLLCYEFEKQYIFGGRCVADAYIEKINCLIQFDGDFWHGNEKAFPNLNEYQKKQKEQDIRVNNFAFSKGYNLIRIWESDLTIEYLKFLLQKVETGTKICVHAV